jgi:hypothetical protein
VGGAAWKYPRALGESMSIDERFAVFIENESLSLVCLHYKGEWEICTRRKTFFSLLSIWTLFREMLFEGDAIQTWT